MVSKTIRKSSAILKSIFLGFSWISGASWLPKSIKKLRKTVLKNRAILRRSWYGVRRLLGLAVGLRLSPQAAPGMRARSSKKQSMASDSRVHWLLDLCLGSDTPWARGPANSVNSLILYQYEFHQFFFENTDSRDTCFREWFGNSLILDLC